MSKEISDQDKLIQLLDWAEGEEWFNDAFLKSLEEATEKPWFNGFSSAQSKAIDNMFVRFIG
jgi:hypothetical protein